MYQGESGFALNVLLNIFKAITLQNALLQCEIHILATDLIIRSEDVLLLLPYLSIFIPDRFSVNSFFLIGLFVCSFPSLANLFPGGGEFELKIFLRGWGFWYDLIRAFVKSPGSGGMGVSID